MDTVEHVALVPENQGLVIGLFVHVAFRIGFHQLRTGIEIIGIQLQDFETDVVVAGSVSGQIKIESLGFLEGNDVGITLEAV